MPFEVFRRHQRKLLAIFAILAMISFVVSDSVPRLLSSNYNGRDQKVVDLHSAPLYRSQLNELARQRNRANMFVAGLAQFMPREVFGGLKDRDLVDAVILQREADRLGIPATPEMGREWLKQITGGRMNSELFSALYSRFSSEISEEQLLTDIANQVRLANVRRLARFADRHSLRRLPVVPRSERADRRQAGRGARRQVPLQGSRALSEPTFRLFTTSTRTFSPIPAAKRPASRCRGRCRSKSSRSTAMPCSAAFATS